VSRTWWIVVGVAAVGVGLAVLLGVLGTRNEDDEAKSEATSSLCTSLQSLETSIENLVNLDRARRRRATTRTTSRRCRTTGTK
jgi:hypothetical protein